MDHMARLQAIASRDPCLAGGTTAKRAAFDQQFRPRGPMYSAIHATSAQQAFICSIYDGIDIEARDVALDDFDAAHFYQ